MKADNQAVNGIRMWVGRVLLWLTSAFLLMDVAMHLLRPPFAVEASSKLGLDPTTLGRIGMFECIAFALWITPRFRTLGALLFTAFLGGATAAHVLVSKTPFAFPIILAVLLWVCVVCLSPAASRELGLEDSRK